MTSHGTLNRLLIAMRDNDEQIHIAVFVGRSPGMRAEQNDLFRLKLGDQPLGQSPGEALGATLSFIPQAPPASREDRV